MQRLIPPRRRDPHGRRPASLRPCTECSTPPFLVAAVAAQRSHLIIGGHAQPHLAPNHSTRNRCAAAPLLEAATTYAAAFQEAVRSTRCSTASSALTPPSSSIILISTLSTQNMRGGGPTFGRIACMPLSYCRRAPMRVSAYCHEAGGGRRGGGRRQTTRRMPAVRSGRRCGVTTRLRTSRCSRRSS